MQINNKFFTHTEALTKAPANNNDRRSEKKYLSSSLFAHCNTLSLSG